MYDIYIYHMIYIYIIWYIYIIIITIIIISSSSVLYRLISIFHCIIVLTYVRCSPDVAPCRNCGRVAYFWKAMSVVRYVDVYVIHGDHDDHHHHNHHHHHRHHHHPLWRQVGVIIRFSIFVIGVVELLIPSKDTLMLFLFQHICHRGWRI